MPKWSDRWPPPPAAVERQYITLDAQVDRGCGGRPQFGGVFAMSILGLVVR